MHINDALRAPGATPDTTPTLIRRTHANMAADTGDVEDNDIVAPVVRLFAKATRPAFPRWSSVRSCVCGGIGVGGVWGGVFTEGTAFVITERARGRVSCHGARCSGRESYLGGGSGWQRNGNNGKERLAVKPVVRRGALEGECENHMIT